MKKTPDTSTIQHVAQSAQRYARERRLQVQMWQFSVDFFCLLLAGILGFGIRFQSSLLHFGVTGFRSIEKYFFIIILGALSFQFLLYWFQTYDHKNILRYRLIIRIFIKVSIIWIFAFLGLTLIFKVDPPISRLFVLYTAILSLSTLLLWRTTLYFYFRHALFAPQLRLRALIVGWTQQAESLLKSIQHDPQHPYEVLGCVPSAHGTFHDQPPGYVEVFGDYNEIPELIHLHKIDTLILSDLNPNVREIASLANLCEKELVEFKIIPSYFDVLLSGLHLETISGVPLLGVTQLPLDHPYNRALKRLVDVIGAMIGLVLSVPLTILFGWMVYRESPGPIFYFQKRLGRSGQIFYIIKIRSMRMDAESETGAQWCKEDDPRRLKIGEFMRKWNIDEVPQFWNVLIGQMSLVGPRPERPELIEDFKEDIPHYQARHSVKPGLTGWAQIHGFRGDTDLNERIRCDLYYLENWSLPLDFYIMLMTFFKRDNAY
ncbi:MAG: sugar transferase [Verrucomicrobiota bacterium]